MVIGPVAITCNKAHLSLGSFVGCLLLPTPPKQPSTFAPHQTYLAYRLPFNQHNLDHRSVHWTCLV